MKITVYYEDKRESSIIDVPDDECALWVENDYKRRLAEAEDKSAVARRTPQEIMDEEYNKPTYNNNQTETRRHIHLDALDPEDKHLDSGTDLLAEIIKREEYGALYEAIAKLQPQQIELLKRVFWDGANQRTIAVEDNVSDRAITSRMKKIYLSLKKILSDDFSE